jgi:hypothetical protein
MLSPPFVPSVAWPAFPSSIWPCRAKRSPACPSLGMPAVVSCAPSCVSGLGRVLTAYKPTLVVLGYGINDGIFQPLDEGRFKAYRDGLTSVRAECLKAGAKVVLLTPPPYGVDKPADTAAYDAVMAAVFFVVGAAASLQLASRRCAHPACSGPSRQPRRLTRNLFSQGMAFILVTKAISCWPKPRGKA